MDIIYSEERNGKTMLIVPDYTCDNPRETDCQFGTIYATRRNYDYDGHKISEILDENGNVTKDYIALPVYFYEHSGITIWTETPNHYYDKWDTGLFGYIAVSKKKVLTNWNRKRMSSKLLGKVNKALKYEIDELDAWLQGECYGFIVKDEDGNEIDSCYGFIGDAGMEDAKIYARDSM